MAKKKPITKKKKNPELKTDQTKSKKKKVEPKKAATKSKKGKK